MTKIQTDIDSGDVYDAFCESALERKLVLDDVGAENTYYVTRRDLEDVLNFFIQFNDLPLWHDLLAHPSVRLRSYSTKILLPCVIAAVLQHESVARNLAIMNTPWYTPSVWMRYLELNVPEDQKVKPVGNMPSSLDKLAKMIDAVEKIHEPLREAPAEAVDTVTATRTAQVDAAAVQHNELIHTLRHNGAQIEHRLAKIERNITYTLYTGITLVAFFMIAAFVNLFKYFN